MNRRIVLMCCVGCSLILFGFKGNTLQELLEMAKSYAAIGMHDKAVNYYNKAIAIDPKSEDAYRARAFYYLNRDKRQLALDDLTTAIGIAPESSEIYVSRGLILLSDKKKDLATQDFKHACDLKSESGCGFFKEISSINQQH